MIQILNLWLHFQSVLIRDPCVSSVEWHPYSIVQVGLLFWPRGYKLFSCSTQLSTKFQLLIKTKIPTNEEVSCFKFLRCCVYHANKCKNANDCWHFKI